MKQVIVVRIDLDMGKGKIAAQVGHACVLGAEHVRKSNPDWFKEWWSGQEKIVVKVTSLKELEEIKEHAFSLNVPCSEVTDAGHTQIEPGTTTCVSLGPAPEDLVDKISGNLKLL
jgi:PTH2 family peptidyl-tRNA hydrolase